MFIKGKMIFQKTLPEVPRNKTPQSPFRKHAWLGDNIQGGASFMGGLTMVYCCANFRWELPTSCVAIQRNHPTQGWEPRLSGTLHNLRIGAHSLGRAASPHTSSATKPSRVGTFAPRTALLFSVPLNLKWLLA